MASKRARTDPRLAQPSTTPLSRLFTLASTRPGSDSSGTISVGKADVSYLYLGAIGVAGDSHRPRLANDRAQVLLGLLELLGPRGGERMPVQSDAVFGWDQCAAGRWVS
jgi:hypothetical protein